MPSIVLQDALTRLGILVWGRHCVEMFYLATLLFTRPCIPQFGGRSWNVWGRSFYIYPYTPVACNVKPCLLQWIYLWHYVYFLFLAFLSQLTPTQTTQPTHDLMNSTLGSPTSIAPLTNLTQRTPILTPQPTPGPMESNPMSTAQLTPTQTPQPTLGPMDSTFRSHASTAQLTPTQSTHDPMDSTSGSPTSTTSLTPTTLEQNISSTLPPMIPPPTIPPPTCEGEIMIC